MQHAVNAQDLADALNKLRLTDPMWSEGGFRVSGRWLEIDPDASDELAAHMLGIDLEKARRRNDREARWLVAGGVGVVYTEGKGWQPAQVPVTLIAPEAVEAAPEQEVAPVGAGALPVPLDEDDAIGAWQAAASGEAG
jgi:hypothetical protein